MKWYLQNTSRRLRFVISHPRYSLVTAAREVMMADERFLGTLAGQRIRNIRAYLQEPCRTREFVLHLRSCEADFHSGFNSADLWAKKVLVQYAVIRALKPDVVVETGVASGVSTSYLLLALAKNCRGVLHSIELGDASYLPAGKAPGWIVPEWLKPRWHLHVGDAVSLLPAVLAELPEVDVFIHDSLHTYEHMKFELETAYRHIRPGGLLLADDALWNSAFTEVARVFAAPAAAILRGVGIMKK